MARCWILLSSSALNNQAKKSLYSSFCLEKSPLPSTKNPIFAQETQIGSHSVFQQQLTESGDCGRRQAAERGGRRGAVCSHPFFHVVLFSPV